MKRILIVFIVVGLFSGLSFPQLAFRFYGGMTHVMSKDNNSSVEATNELLDLYDPGHKGYFEKFCCGINLGGELFYLISKNIGVGIGIELIRLRSESNLSYGLDVPIVQTTTYGIKAFPITLNVHYIMPVTSLLNAYISLGTGLYFMDLDFTSDFLWDSGSLDIEDQTYTFQTKKGTLGIQVRWGIEVFVFKNISFQVGGTGRYAKFSDISGDWTRQGYNLGEGHFDESGSNHFFWYYEESIEGTNYPQVVFSETAPTGMANARKGKIHLSGLSFTAGIKIGLDFKKK